MRTLFLILIILFIFPIIAFSAPFLACDIPTDAWTGSDVEIDGQVFPGLFQVSSDGQSLLLFDLQDLEVGAHTFRARFKDHPDWPGESGWSNPFDATKPGGVPGGVKVIRD